MIFLHYFIEKNRKSCELSFTSIIKKNKLKSAKSRYKRIYISSLILKRMSFKSAEIRKKRSYVFIRDIGGINISDLILKRLRLNSAEDR